MKLNLPYTFPEEESEKSPIGFENFALSFLPLFAAPTKFGPITQFLGEKQEKLI